MSLPDEDDVLRLLMGRSMRARLAMWILQQPPVFSQKDAVEANGGYAHQTAVRQELEKLELLEMIALAPTDERGNYFHRLPHPLWSVFEALERALADLNLPA